MCHTNIKHVTFKHTCQITTFVVQKSIKSKIYFLCLVGEATCLPGKFKYNTNAAFDLHFVRGNSQIGRTFSNLANSKYEMDGKK